jgi:metal-responsive CopG/Arc/MetJ family transcriptional regulator
MLRIGRVSLMRSVEERAISVRLPSELYELLRRFAFDRRISQAEIIRAALQRYLTEEQC